MIRSIDYLKNRFITGSQPTQDDFYDIIDTAQVTVSRTVSQAASKPGFVVINGLSLNIVGDTVFNGLIEAETTASAQIYTIPLENVFVSADYAVVGTAGVTATGIISTGVKIGLEPFTTPGWITAGNRISVDVRGRLTATTLETTDFGFSYYTSVASGLNYMTFCHPSMASAKSIIVHCSGLAPNTNSTLGIRYVTSTTESVVDTYTCSSHRVALSSVTNTKANMALVTTTAAFTSVGTYSIDAVITPMPANKNAHSTWAIMQTTLAGHYATGQASLVASADSTIAGVQLCLTGTDVFKKQGIVRIGII